MVAFKRLVLMATAFSLTAGQSLGATVKVPEGTEFPMRLEETLSSKSANEGDRFTVSLVDDVKLSDGTVLRGGYRGVGEVVDARNSGMLGKTGTSHTAAQVEPGVRGEGCSQRSFCRSLVDRRAGQQMLAP